MSVLLLPMSLLWWFVKRRLWWREKQAVVVVCEEKVEVVCADVDAEGFGPRMAPF
jgi:hypothetical protein